MSCGLANLQFASHTLRPLIDGLYRDLTVLAGRKQEAPLSKAKITMMNKLLNDAKMLLADEPTCNYLELLDEQAIPNNADALLILGQYKTALERFQAKYSSREIGGIREWNFKGQQK
jgi:hypothetical protein